MVTARISPKSARIILMLSPLPWERSVKGSIEIDTRSGEIGFDDVYAPRLVAQSRAPGFPQRDRQAIDQAVARLGRSRTRGGLVKIIRLPNGKWRGTVIDEQGKPVEYQDFTTLAAAQRWKRDEMKEIHVGSGRGRRRAAPLHHHGHGVG
jgi:hypothetical protein